MYVAAGLAGDTAHRNVLYRAAETAVAVSFAVA